MKKTKRINEANLNSLVANERADKFINKVLKKQAPEFFCDSEIEPRVHLNKLVLRADFFNHRAGVPFYAFTKHIDDLNIIVDVKSAKIDVVDSSTIASQTEVKGNFTIDGVVYDKKDMVNGQPRYCCVGGKICKSRTTAKQKNKERELINADILAALIAECFETIDGNWELDNVEDNGLTLIIF